MRVTVFNVYFECNVKACAVLTRVQAHGSRQSTQDLFSLVLLAPKFANYSYEDF